MAARACSPPNPPGYSVIIHNSLPCPSFNILQRRKITSNTQKIIYTHTDEAPALATYSFLPIIKAFAGVCDVAVETRDISLAGRIIASFPEELTEEQRISDVLAELGELVKKP